jgi:hypothetical protein
MRLRLLCICLWLGITAPTGAQYSLGVGVVATVNFHVAHFRSLSPDIPNCCPGFEQATGVGWGVAGTYDGLRIAPRLRLLAEGGYIRQEATFRQQEQTTVSSPEGTGVSGMFEHELQTRLELLTTSLLLGYSPVEEIPQWQVRAGVQAGWMLRSTFSQRERLVEPPYGYFSDTGTRVRNEYTGSIPGTPSFVLALGIGTRYLLPLVPRQQIALQPALMGWLSLTRLVSGVSWRAHSVAFSLSIVYAPLEMPSPLQPGTQP